MNEWTKVLDCCPGLLCCVINAKGKLLYASLGYKNIAARLFGHTCKEGGNYPPMITDFDKTLHDVLMLACLGKPSAIEFTEHDKTWEITTSPLRVSAKNVDGVVIKISSENKNPAAKNLPPIIQSNPEILDSVPFRACVVDSHGGILAVNKFLSSSAKTNLTGKNIIEFINHDTNSGLLGIINKSSGCIECKIHDIEAGKNFYDFSNEIYLDEEYNDSNTADLIKNKDVDVRLHASPIKWNGKDCVMITFEDISELQNTNEQLRRILTFDNYNGILNRRGMEHAIIQKLSEAIKNAEHLSLIMINIDNFSSLNETRGYSNANRILRGFVNIMKKYLSEHGENIISHWGGDEFMILLNCSGAAAVVLANEIREKTTTLKISAGVADLSIGGYSGMNDFIAAAYDAMIEAKVSGGERTILSK